MALRWWRRYSPRHSQLSPGDEFDGTEDADEDDANRDNDAEFAESLEDAILQLVNGVMEDEIERLVSENVKRAEDQLFTSSIDCSELHFVVEDEIPETEVDDTEPCEVEIQRKPAFNLFEELENQIVVQEVDKSKKAVKKKREEEKKKMKSDKQKKTIGRRKKSDQTKVRQSKRKPQVTDQFIGAVEFSSEELNEDETVSMVTQQRLSDRTRKIPILI